MSLNAKYWGVCAVAFGIAFLCDRDLPAVLSGAMGGLLVAVGALLLSREQNK
jgi:hypothetical protein